MAWEEIKSSGITSKTPGSIIINAYTIHKGLTFTAGSEGATGAWNFAESLIGATSGGTKITIKPEFFDIPVDGAMVKVKGLTVKVGETAAVETNMTEITPEFIKTAVVGQDGTSEFNGYDVIESKRQIEEGDYIENLGIIGRFTDGRPVIVIFDNALCTSGFESEGKNKENTIVKATFECFAELSSEADVLPYHIYTPTPEQSA